jgi:hypothetical protein
MLSAAAFFFKLVKKEREKNGDNAKVSTSWARWK